MFGLFVLSHPAPAAATDTQRARRPNILFILVDDLGWTDLGCYGSKFYETPNIDRLAASGIRFTQAYAACPVCSPTRASILTGKYPARLKTTDYFGAAQPEKWRRRTPLLPAPYLPRLPLAEVTIAERLHSLGYRTFFAGKWHLGGQGYAPEDQGFDINKGGLERGGPYGGKKYFSPYGNPKLSDGPRGEHLPDRLARESGRFIESCGDAPFLAYLSFYSVHTPLMSRADLQEKYERKKEAMPPVPESDIWDREGKRKHRRVQNHVVYAGMVEAMDQAVGKVLAALDRCGHAEDTVVFFMSDNGGLSTSEGHPTTNLPLRAGKGWLYEGGIREPMLIRWPRVVDPGRTSATPVISNDFAPTIAEITGVDAGKHDGQSLVPLLRGSREQLASRALYWHYPHYGNQGGSPSSAIRAGDWKLIEFFEDHRVELYDLHDDIGEKHDRASAEPERAAELREQLAAWRRDVGALLPSPNPRFLK